MIELPEAVNLAKQLRDNIAGKRVVAVRPPSKPHKFCWFNGDPADYDKGLRGAVAVTAESFGIYAEIVFDNGKKLCVNDGVNMRLVAVGDAPASYQLLIEFTDGMALAFTVAMYGGIVLHDGDYDNEYYLKSKNAVDVFGDGFDGYFRKLLAAGKPTLSAKAFLATEQRFPGLGNGVLQDMLLTAGIHPKRKISTLSANDISKLYRAVRLTADEMLRLGGRDTENDIFGNKGGYVTRLGAKALGELCPVCGVGPVRREAYLGGNIYYCPECQPLP